MVEIAGISQPTDRPHLAAFILQSFHGANFIIALDFFRAPKSRLTRQRTCDCSARRSLAEASVGDCRTVAPSFANSAPGQRC
jgi:hypothetical protein